jgi:hypothetical protein
MTATFCRLSLQAAALLLALISGLPARAFLQAASPAAAAQRRTTGDPAGAEQATKPGRAKETTKPARPRKGEAEARRSELEARRARERREAVAVILEVAAGAKEVEDAHERHALLTDCADALWPADEAAARALFRLAWAAATEADEATHEAEQGPGLLRSDTLARRDVAAAAARRDARLAEEFIDDLRARTEKRAGSEEGEGGREGRRGPRGCAAAAVEGQRIELADSLLADGALEAAADVVAPLAGCGAGGGLVLFLFRLRPHAPERAHTLFLRVLEAVRADPSADANAVLAAAAYLAPPGLLTTVDERGSVMFLDAASGAAKPPPPFPRQVREAFYETAAAVLLRPQQPAAGAAHNPAALYFAVGRLLPFFEREAPRHAPALHARRTALAAEIEPARRATIEQQAGVRRLTAENPTDPLRPYLDSIEGATTAAGRDGWRLGAARAAARRRFWERARQFARDIEGDELRRSALLIINAYQVDALHEAFDEGKEEDVESAVGFVRAADLPPALRALGLVRAATLAARGRDRARAHELLNEALARAAEADKPFRAVAALLTAEHAARLDSPRVWEALAAAVAAANSDESEPAAGPELYRRAGSASGEEAETLHEIFDAYSLEAIFELVALRDFARALAGARSVREEPTRSRSLVAAARAVIEHTEAAPRRKAVPR